MARNLYFRLLLGLIISLPFVGKAQQCPTAAFSIGADTVCVNQPIPITNTSVGASSYEWDFCGGAGQLSNPTSIAAYELSSGGAYGQELVYDGNIWRSFIINYNGTITRLDYTNGLEATPVATTLTIAGLTAGYSISIVKEDNGIWRGIISSIGVGNSFIRLDFGTSLSNAPIPSAPESIPTASLVRGIQIVKENDIYYLVVSASSSSTISVVNLGNSLANPITASNTITNTFNGKIFSRFRLVKNCNKWIGLIGTTTSAVYQATFTNTIFSEPSLQPVNINGVQGSAFYDVTFFNRLDHYYGIIASYDNAGYLLDFSNILDTNPTVSSLPIIGNESKLIGLSIAQQNNYTYVTSIADYSLSKLYRARFGQSCPFITTNPTAAQPTIAYTVAGKYKFSLFTHGDNTAMDSVVVIQSNIKYSVDASCNSSTFAFSNNSCVGANPATYLWDFGDGNTATTQNATHTYTTPNQYTVTLTVTDANGVSYSRQQKILYQAVPPVADFAYTNPVCSGGENIFTDNTISPIDTVVSWHWDLGNNTTANTQNAAAIYSTPGSYNVTLTITTQNGCTSSITKQVDVALGPDVNFDYEKVCFADTVSFTDNSFFPSGTTYLQGSRLWNFGDNTTDTTQNPKHHFTEAKTYTVSLRVSSTDGCVSSFTRNVTILPLPTANFSAPTLIFPTMAVPFTDLSMASGQTIIDWEWDFGDPASGVNNVSAFSNPTHNFSTADIYTVTLTVTTDQGCRHTVTKQIDILRNCPETIFSLSTHTANTQENVTATNGSSGGASKFRWDLCAGDLSKMPLLEQAFTTSYFTRNVSLFADKGKCYLFAPFYTTATPNNPWQRFDFGNSFSNSPTPVLLGNPANGATPNALNVPIGMRVFRKDTALYGLAINSSTGNLVRLFFADSVDSDIVTANLLPIPGITKPENIEIVQDGDSLYAFLTCNSGSINNLLVRLSFGNSFLNTPIVTILDNTVLQSSNSGALLGMSVIRDCNTWYMVVVSNSGKIIRLNFGISLNRTPSYQNVTTQWTAGLTELTATNPLVKISLHREMGYIYGIGVTKFGTMVNFKFSSLMANPIRKQVWSGNILSIADADIRDAQFIKVGSQWHGFASLSNNGLGVLKWSFPNPCSTSQPIRNEPIINNFSYTQAGTYYISLETSDSRDWTSTSADSVIVSSTNGSEEMPYTCPSLSVEVPANACANQTLNLTAATDTSNQVVWDMCAGDLSDNITFEASSSLPNTNRARGISIVKDGAEYFGLIASTNEAVPIVFARFGSSFDNGVNTFIYPTSSSLLSCYDAKLVNENGKWIGFLSNSISTYSIANQIVRLNWNGEPLSSNTPQLSFISGKGQLNMPDGIEVAEENGQKYLFVVNNNTARTIAVYSFGDSYLNSPSVSSFVVDSAVSIQRISMIKDCNRWYALVSDQQGGAVIRLDFSKGLDQKPIFKRIAIGANKFPTGVKLWRDNGKYYAIVVSYSNNINFHFKVGFGDKMANNTISVTDMGNNGGLANDMVGFDMLRTNQSETKLIGAAFTAPINIYKFKFQNPCVITNPILTGGSSTNVVYTQNGNYNVAVTVTDTNGNVYSVGNPIQIKNPVVADFNSSGVFCKGQTVNFTKASIIEPNTQGLTYLWNFADPNSATNSATTENATHIFTEAGTYNVSYSVGSGSGCNSIKQKTIKIYNPPQADFTFQNTSIGLCANDSILFSDASTVDVGDQINLYQWIIKDSDANILFTSSQKNPKFLFTQVGSYTATLTVWGNGGCPNAITQTFNITNLGAAISIDMSSDICEGSAITYTANVNSADITEVFWNLGDNQTSSEMNPTITYAGSGTRIVTLRVTNAVGCTSTTSKLVTIYARPQAVINTNTAACRNSSLILSATSSISEGLITNYDWSFGDGTPNQSAATVSHTYTNIGLYNVRLIITTQYGCKDTSEVVISVAPSPTAAFTAPSVCVNKPVNFTNQSSSIGGSLTYFWQFRNVTNTADLGTSTLANPTFTFTTAGTYPVILTVQDGQCSNTISQNLVISGIPQASISIEEGCVGTPFTFHDNTTYPTPSDVPVAWFWTIIQNSQTIQTMTTANPQVLLPAGTGYSVQLKVFTQKGCEATSPIFSFPVAAPPVAAFNVLTTTFTAAPFNVSFQNTSSNAVNYLWDFGDGQTSTETNPTHTYAAEGLYMVTLKAIRNVCNDTATHSAGIFVNISKGVKLSNLSVTGTGSLTIAARIQNESNVELNTLTMQAQTSDGLTINETWTGSLLPNASLVYTFGAKLYVRNDNVVPFVCAETQLPNPMQEITPDNNSACQVLSSSSFLLAVSPVPADQKLSVRYLVAQADEVTIELIDMLGRRVYVQEYGTQAAGKYEQDIDVTQMTTGMYYLRLIVGKQKTGDKISVQH